MQIDVRAGARTRTREGVGKHIYSEFLVKIIC